MWAELAATGELLALPTTVQQDSDVIPDMPLYIGMDYNANINWIVAMFAVLTFDPILKIPIFEVIFFGLKSA